jgi:hypothetical protein
VGGRSADEGKKREEELTEGRGRREKKGEKGIVTVEGVPGVVGVAKECCWEVAVDGMFRSTRRERRDGGKKSRFPPK